MGDFIRGHMKLSLARVVGGLTAFVTDFDGPATAYIGTHSSTPYVTLCSHGIKAEGEAAPSFGWQEAIELYAAQLAAMIAEHKDEHLAWRCRPQMSCDGEGKYRVYSRLAFI